MPGGHASHKGKSVKPNTNAEGQLDTAADLATDPNELISEGPDAHRAEQAPQNEQATERPEK
ncbi:MAG: hypothetical protein Kow00121_02480 [Elainellaceae cyanobacterium]